MTDFNLGEAVKKATDEWKLTHGVEIGPNQLTYPKMGGAIEYPSATLCPICEYPKGDPRCTHWAELCPICELPEDDESCPHIWTTFKEIPLGEDFYDEYGNWLEKRSEKMGLGWCDGNPEYLFFEPEEKVRRK